MKPILPRRRRSERERVGESGTGRVEQRERGEISHGPTSLLYDGVWSAGGPLCVGGPGRGAGVCVWL